MRDTLPPPKKTLGNYTPQSELPTARVLVCASGKIGGWGLTVLHWISSFSLSETFLISAGRCLVFFTDQTRPQSKS